MDQIAIKIPRPSVKEGSAFTATAYFRDRATGAASAPTTIHYRIDNLSTGTALAALTSVGAAASASISITATHNAIQDDTNDYEVIQLTVVGDSGFSTQVRETAVWRVENIQRV